MYSSFKLKFVDSVAFITNRFGLLDWYSFIKNNLKSYVAILVYHRVGTNKDKWSVSTIDTKDFEMHMKYLLKNYKIITLEKMADAFANKKDLPKKSAIVTFDDGYMDNYTNAFPVLNKYKIPATIFLTTGHIGTDNLFWWDKVGYILCNTNLKKINLGDFGAIYPPSDNNLIPSLDEIIGRFNKISEGKKCVLIENIEKNTDVDIPKNLGRDIIMSWEEVKEMYENGIGFGAHTVTHPILTKISLQQAEYEIIQSKKDIEKRLNSTVNTFCYPNGLYSDFNEEIKKLLRENGFICASTVIPKMITKKTDLLELGRLPPGKNFNLFKFCISGLYSDILQWRL